MTFSVSRLLHQSLHVLNAAQKWFHWLCNECHANHTITSESKLAQGIQAASLNLMIHHPDWTVMQSCPPHAYLQVLFVAGKQVPDAVANMLSAEVEYPGFGRAVPCWTKNTQHDELDSKAPDACPMGARQGRKTSASPNRTAMTAQHACPHKRSYSKTADDLSLYCLSASLTAFTW